MKELEFEENWQSMKVGKNKPLDAEEVEFLDEVENALRASEAKRKRGTTGSQVLFCCPRLLVGGGHLSAVCFMCKTKHL